MSDNNVFSYTHRDYDGARKEGLAKIPQLSNGVWTDLNATDPGIIILDYVHALADMISYYQDHQALEAFMTTAKERSNIFRLAQQFSYKIRSAKSAQVEVVFHSDFYYDNLIKIPKYTKVSTSDSINYLTTEDAYIRVGENEVSVLCKQGTLITQIYEGTGQSRFSVVENSVAENQSLTLTAANIDIDSIIITDDVGRTWNPVDHIVFSGPTDRVYQAILNPENTITIKFGDGERGVIPKETDILTITYIITDAEKGSIGAGAIVNHDTIYDEKGLYVELTVTNPESSIGGSAPQSSSSIRELAPGYIKAQGRAVTLSDYEILARQVEGVADAKAYDVNTNPEIPYQEVRVFIIPEKTHTSNKLLVSQVYEYLSKRMIPPTRLQVSLPSSIAINIEITVKKLGDINDGVLEAEISQVISNYFNDRIGEIAEPFYPTDLATAVSNITNVKSVVSISPNNVVEIGTLSVATLGALKITIQ